MSYKPVVKVAGDGQWNSNALRFATEEEAKESAKDLAHRWMLVTAYSAQPSDDPVNYVREHGKDVRIADPVPATKEA